MLDVLLGTNVLEALVVALVEGVDDGDVVVVRLAEQLQVLQERGPGQPLLGLHRDLEESIPQFDEQIAVRRKCKTYSTNHLGIEIIIAGLVDNDIFVPCERAQRNR